LKHTLTEDALIIPLFRLYNGAAVFDETAWVRKERFC